MRYGYMLWFQRTAQAAPEVHFESEPAVAAGFADYVLIHGWTLLRIECGSEAAPLTLEDALDRRDRRAEAALRARFEGAVAA